ncbi:MAG: hypothetical protein LBP42_06240 [Treponema sp.]|jgi:hypothetical protein|nr:hypothetical protein [Treponema sp.]
MENFLQEGILLGPEDCKILFSLLKRNENALLTRERNILLKIERILYEHLSIQDIENLLRSPYE